MKVRAEEELDNNRTFIQFFIIRTDSISFYDLSSEPYKPMLTILFDSL